MSAVRLAVVAITVWLWTGPAFGQMVTTTLTADVSTTDLTFTVASGTGIAPGFLLLVDFETVPVIDVSGTTITIRERGYGGLVTAHATNAMVTAGPPQMFATTDPPVGTCLANYSQTPWVNYTTGDTWLCSRMGYWQRLTRVPMGGTAGAVMASGGLSSAARVANAAVVGTVTGNTTAGLTLNTSTAAGPVAFQTNSTARGSFQANDWGLRIEPGNATSTQYVLENRAGNLYFNGVLLDTGGASLSGTPGRLAKFTGAASVGDSVITESGATISVAGTIASTQFGTHSFSAGGAGSQLVAVRNTTAGASALAGLRLGNDAAAQSALLVATSSTFSVGGDVFADGTLLRGERVGGLTLSASDAAGALKFFSGGSAERMRLHASGGLSLGNTVDPGAGVFSAAQAVLAPATGTTKALTITQNAAGGSSGGSYAWNQITLTGDNATLTNPAFGEVVQVYHEYGGAAMTGGRNSFEVFSFLTAATSASNTNRNYVGAAFSWYGYDDDGGTGGSPQGAGFGGNFVATLANGATNYQNLSGIEIDVGAETGSSVNYKTGIQIAGKSTNAVHGTIEAAIAVSNATGSVGWDNGLLFTNSNGANAISAGGTLIKAYGAQTAGLGVDLSGWTFSDSAWKSDSGLVQFRAANQWLHLGSNTSNTPIINFHSSANANNYDTRIYSTGGSGSDGQGQLVLEGNTSITLIGGPLILTSVTFANLGTPGNGSLRYCSDCTIANPCAAAGTGALAKRLNGAWVCN